MSPLDLDLPEDTPRIDVHLRPLGVADVRRTVVATAPLTGGSGPGRRARPPGHGRPPRPDGPPPAAVAGRPAGAAAEGDLVLPDIASDWLQWPRPGRAAGGPVGLAMAPAPVTPTLIEEVVHVPPEAVLADLQDRGLVLSVKRWHVSAGAFRPRRWTPAGIRTAWAPGSRRPSPGGPAKTLRWTRPSRPSCPRAMASLRRGASPQPRRSPSARRARRGPSGTGSRSARPSACSARCSSTWGRPARGTAARRRHRPRPGDRAAGPAAARHAPAPRRSSAAAPTAPPAPPPSTA